jgi:hypothetical protein
LRGEKQYHGVLPIGEEQRRDRLSRDAALQVVSRRGGMAERDRADMPPAGRPRLLFEPEPVGSGVLADRWMGNAEASTDCGETGGGF